MKVKDLLAILGDLDPEANIQLATQPHYPMEYSVAGVVVRSEVCEEEDDELSGGARRNDVLLLEGSHLRYGAKAAWDPARAQR